MTLVEAPSLRPIKWRGESLALLDQTRLPSEEVWLDLVDYRDVIALLRDPFESGLAKSVEAVHA